MLFSMVIDMKKCICSTHKVSMHLQDMFVVFVGQYMDSKRLLVLG
jgi:hypothetical protein